LTGDDLSNVCDDIGLPKCGREVSLNAPDPRGLVFAFAGDAGSRSDTTFVLAMNDAPNPEISVSYHDAGAVDALGAHGGSSSGGGGSSWGGSVGPAQLLALTSTASYGGSPLVGGSGGSARQSSPQTPAPSNDNAPGQGPGDPAPDVIVSNVPPQPQGPTSPDTPYNPDDPTTPPPPDFIPTAPPTPTAVPEPASLALFGLGLAFLGVVVRRRKSA